VRAAHKSNTVHLESLWGATLMLLRGLR